MPHKKKKQKTSSSFDLDIKRITAENVFNRRVLHTGLHSQLVLMSIPPEGETGEENQEDTDKMLFIVRGKATSILNRRARDAGKHDVIIVPAGSLQNLTNTGRHDLNLFVLYSPPLYADGTVHRTAEDAMEARRKKFAHDWEQ